MNAPFPYKSIWEYLEMQGVLEADDATIKAAKKDYWKLYNRHKKREARQNRQEFHPAFSREETKLLQAEAQRHGRAVTQLIHDAALAYIERRYIVPSRSRIAELELLLSKSYTAIQSAVSKLPEERRMSLLALMRTVEELEKAVRKTLYAPAMLEEALRSLIKEHPEQRDRLLSLLKAPSP